MVNDYVLCKRNVYIFEKGKAYRYEKGMLIDTAVIKVFYDKFDVDMFFYFNLEMPKWSKNELNFKRYFYSDKEIRYLKLKKIDNVSIFEKIKLFFKRK